MEISEIEAVDPEKLKEQIMSSMSLSESKLRRVMERYVSLHLASMASRSHVSLSTPSLSGYWMTCQLASNAGSRGNLGL